LIGKCLGTLLERDILILTKTPVAQALPLTGMIGPGSENVAVVGTGALASLQ
jgi:hypothetical protein